MDDGDKLVAWLIEGANEIQQAHRLLDDLGAPRTTPGDVEISYTLAARIARLADKDQDLV
jgi:hypothetical protein